MKTSRADVLFRYVTIAVASVVVGLFVVYFVELVSGSSLTLSEGFVFITSSIWTDVAFGVYPMLWGSLVTSAIALCIGVPISVGVAIFLSEISKGRLRSTLGFLVEMLAAVPSVVYGLWGLFILTPILSTYVYPVLEQYVGFLPIFSCPDTFVPCYFYGVSVMTAGVVLAIMIIPIVAAISRDALMAVPNSQREAAYALGATRSEAINMSVLSYARSGIIAAIFLGFARAFGETMAVVMLIGNERVVSTSLLHPGYTLASLIANEFSEASSPVAVSALIEAGLVLLVVAFMTSFIGRLMIRRFLRSREAASYL
ncbi:MAG TPA: phosphate ABC transporter permease subunit PstC [Nitrososphaerales archaeon]|nr:phosphate ABC transporter permease subunit PstC [Nitrososphaerales archaeon]